MTRYALIEKEVGETPLGAIERWRYTKPELANTPLAYAGRLDPMASGRLLVLIGNECRRQKHYHALDKAYEFSVLFGVSSDTGDVLGRLQHTAAPKPITTTALARALNRIPRTLTLPYPKFSAKTVRGKPLHMWTLEERLHEIDIPAYTATVYRLHMLEINQRTGTDLATEALQKIETIPPVTDPRKALGNDFRRTDVRRDWQIFREKHAQDVYVQATVHCACSSGLYMRSLAEEIACAIGTTGLAFHIHRTHIGHFHTLLGIPYWTRP